jgi:site-specific DNA-cytosine methylase
MHGEGREEAGGARRFGRNDALLLHKNRYWHDFSADTGGHGALSLLAHLLGDDQAGVDVARTWLAQHPGDGRLGRDDGADKDDPEHSIIDAEAEAFIDAIVLQYSKPVTDSPEAMKYFAARKLDIVATGAALQLKWLSNWRGDEGAIVAPITGNADELVAIQILHITVDGKKSEIQPVRKILRGPHDWRRRGAFRLGTATSAHLVEVEGLEDGIAAMMAGAERVHAVLGASGIGRAELPATVTDVTVARDDDPPGSPASLLLARGVARILLQGRLVKIARRAGTLSAGAKDLNDLLRVHVDLVRRALNDAGFIKPSLDAAEREALLDEVSKASTDAYENNRAALATALGWRVGALDNDRSKRRQARAQQADKGGLPGIDVFDAEPWDDPVTDLAKVLDDAVKEQKRFLVADPSDYDVNALWSAHSHVLHREDLKVSTTSRLAFQSPSKRCGKSTGLKCTYLMSHRPRMASSISPSSLFRAVDDDKVSLMVDEADNLFKHANPDMIGILNSGIDRMTAYVMRSEPVGDGSYKTRYFRTFTAIAFTSIKQLPIDSAQDRVIALYLSRAKKSERPEKLNIESCNGLIDVGRKFARWALDLRTLPKLDRSAELYNRIEDKWVALFQIAAAAGSDWPERCRKAALIHLAREEADDAEGKNADLLADTWKVFYELGRAEIHTKEICATLNEWEESPWSSANNGKPIDAYYLRSNLNDFIPGKAEDIAPRKFSVGGVQAHGFNEKHFEDAFDRYLGRKLPSRTPKGNTTPGGNPLPGAGSNHPSHPSIRLTGTKSGGNSVGCSGTDQNGPSVSSVSLSVPSVPEKRGETDGKTDQTDGENQSVLRNIKQDQQDNQQQDGWTDKTDNLTPRPGEHVSDIPGTGDPAATAKPIGSGEHLIEPAAPEDHSYYEFFAGGGMARHGLGAGWRCLFANDIDADKGAVYCSNWGAGELRVEDVAKLSSADLPGTATLAWASWPCSDLSIAGDRAGLAGERSGTFWPFWRLMTALAAEGRAPRLIALENVCGLLTSDHGRDFAAIGDALAEGGYRFGAVVIDAAHFVPQSRERVFIIAAHRSGAVPGALLTDDPGDPWCPSALLKAHGALSPEARDAWLWWRLPPPPTHSAIQRHRRGGAPWRRVAYAKGDCGTPRDDERDEPRQSRRGQAGRSARGRRSLSTHARRGRSTGAAR